VYDSYRRFIQMFSDVVMEISKKTFEVIIDELKEQKGVTNDIDLDVDDMKTLVQRFKAYYKEQKGEDFPSDPKVQLLESVKAVFRSWDNPRANTYRRMNEIPYSWGTAVNVQPMVFGNLNEDSGTGVAFTRDPGTGTKALFGEYLINAQGEDVVAGVRTPNKIAQLAQDMPEVYAQFVEIANKLENHYRDMQDMEFTIENKTLYMLQTRNGKRTAAAALKIAVDLVDEGMITEEEAVLRVEPQQLDALLHPQFEAKALAAALPIGEALPASPGAACGRVVFTAADAKAWSDQGEKVILVRLETSPDDIEGMAVAQGILTVRGGMTSHAAVVARGMGTCCVSGCGEITMHTAEKYFSLGGKDYKEGDYISLNGSTGKIYGEALPTVEAAISGDFERFMGWADVRRTLKVRTNADNPRDTAQAVKYGAEGIGLCRTEHMFFEGDRIKSMRKMIVARTEEARRLALAELLPYQQKDFTEMYEALEGRPMTVRFLDPPLHEFLPTKADEIAEIATELGLTPEALTKVVESLHEFNPMMGHRGCRLAVSYPEIAEMQTTAVIKAALAVNAAHPEYSIVPEIMIPLVGEIKELKFVKDIVTSTADRLIQEAGSSLHYKVGTMIEIPRAALLADEIAKEAEFFSFGTNDLTQMTFGFSRDDAGAFLDAYYSTKIFESDPFARLDQNGVGKLIKMAVEGGRKTRPDIKLGICGEHGGDPSSVKFCHAIGLDYVSCSPFRVPIARLAAAQAAIRSLEDKK
ncbi:MAG: pyruvate, phosphate dikinase, partial [Oscillospiraceae bacterium]|jgi:pyruvate,orthophosphate dikinase|nr:pyruvate, phosphate dikinase [Oscillospiraceae bacterium]